MLVMNEQIENTIEKIEIAIQEAIKSHQLPYEIDDSQNLSWEDQYKLLEPSLKKLNRRLEKQVGILVKQIRHSPPLDNPMKVIDFRTVCD